MSLLGFLQTQLRSSKTTFRRSVKYSPYESQKRFHTSTRKFTGFSGPIGSGKSLAFCHEALRLAHINHGCQGLVGAPTYPMLRDATRTAFLEILEENNVPYTFRKADNIIYLPEPGSEIMFRSLDVFERLRGTNLAWFGVDELTYCKSEAWLRLEGRLRSPKAKELKGFAVWTPKGFDWVYRLFISDDTRGKDYEAIIAQPGENKHLPEDFYESKKQSYDERFYRQEVLGEYLSLSSGAVYYSFQRKENVRKLEFDPRLPLWWALDFNIDPASSVLCQPVDRTTREQSMLGIRSMELYVLDELVLPDTRTIEACQAFARKVEPWLRNERATVHIYGDASGSNRHSSSLRSDWQIVRDFLKKETPYNAVLHVPDANPPVRERVAAVTSLLCNAAGERNLIVDPRCKELIRDFEEVVFKSGDGDHIDKEKDDKRTHVSDALGYLVHREFPIIPKGGPRSTVIL